MTEKRTTADRTFAIGKGRVMQAVFWLWKICIFELTFMLESLSSANPPNVMPHPEETKTHKVMKSRTSS